MRNRVVFVEDETLLVDLVRPELTDPDGLELVHYENADTASWGERKVDMSEWGRRIWFVDLMLDQAHSQGHDLIRMIKEDYPKDAVVVLTRSRSVPRIWMLVKKAEVDGYIPKFRDLGVFEEINRAIEVLGRGEKYENDQMRDLPDEIPSVITKLTPREIAVTVQMIGGGLPKDVAKTFDTHRSTVSRYRSQALNKTGLSKEELIEVADEEGWIFWQKEIVWGDENSQE